MWPIVALGAATLGGLGWLIFGGKKVEVAPLPSATPQGNEIKPIDIKPVVFNPTTGQPSPFKPNVVNPVTGAPVPKDAPTFVSQVQAEGPARPQAYALMDYIKKNGYKGAPYRDLVAAFQTATNADQMAVALHGPIPVNGIYDTKTSGALSMYTGEVIPADPNAPLPPKPEFKEIVDITKPGAAAISAFNLQVYFRTHKHDKNNPTEKALVKQFQRDVNTDPKYPGPAFGIPGLPKIIKDKLIVDGDLGGPGSKTMAALNIIGGISGTVGMQ